jgi:hypothetical protein
VAESCGCRAVEDASLRDTDEVALCPLHAVPRKTHRPPGLTFANPKNTISNYASTLGRPLLDAQRAIHEAMLKEAERPA